MSYIRNLIGLNFATGKVAGLSHFCGTLSDFLFKKKKKKVFREI